MFGSGGGAGRAVHPAVVASISEDNYQQKSVPFSEGCQCKPTPRSVRIVSRQDSNTATTATRAGSGGVVVVGASKGQI